MNLPAFQHTVAQFVAGHELEATVQVRLLDLISEIGEVAKEALKGTNYGREPFHPPGEWASELGDAFFSLICLANSTGVNLEQTLDEALTKYAARLARKGDAGSGE